MYKSSKTSFQDEWLQMEKYKLWISKIPGQPFKASANFVGKSLMWEIWESPVLIAILVVLNTKTE